jgi:hypothetical protein
MPRLEARWARRVAGSEWLSGVAAKPQACFRTAAGRLPRMYHLPDDAHKSITDKPTLIPEYLHQHYPNLPRRPLVHLHEAIHSKYGILQPRARPRSYPALNRSSETSMPHTSMYTRALFVAFFLAVALAAPQMHHDGTTKGVGNHGLCVRIYIPRGNSTRAFAQIHSKQCL